MTASPVLKGSVLYFGDDVFEAVNAREGIEALKLVAEALRAGHQVFSCGWVVEDYYPEGEGTFTRPCGAPAVGTDRGFECFVGHGHVSMEARAAEGWDYFDSDEIQAMKDGHVLPSVGVRDMTGKPVL